MAKKKKSNKPKKLDPDMDYIMPFGKHKGIQLRYLPTDYLVYLYDNIDIQSPKLKRYVEKHIDAMRDELKEIGKTSFVF